jgi:hypothetical protein
MVEKLTWKRPYRKEFHSHVGGYVVREWKCPYDHEAPPHFHALYKRKAPDEGVMLDFVVMHKTFKTFKAAEDACNKHWRNRCHSMSTDATTADTKRKNSNTQKPARKRRASVQSVLSPELRGDPSDT